jgi:16S rRNA (adenine1518-N6/adenine1519-N6)-dimethyltransferase
MAYTLKKSLGQHFLKDENIIRKIIHTLKENAFENLLEVGPGGGALTKYLVNLPHVNFKAVEVDKEKIDQLLKTYPDLSDKIINKSFLEMDKPFGEPFSIIGNFPYNISTQILLKILDWNDYVTLVIGMFQKEVAQRLASKEGSKVYGVLSVLTQYYYNIEYLFDVAKECFTPQPKVESAVIRLRIIKNKFPVKSERAFKVLVKTAFNQRRKTMRNAVKSLFASEILQEELFTRRAETFSVEEFAYLTFKMEGK